MDKRAALSIALIAIGVGASALVAFGVGTDPPERARPTSAPRSEASTLSSLATPEEMKLWNARGCVTCHGPEGRGGPMAPDVTKVVPLYLRKFGSAEAARDRLAAYILDPAGSEKLRDDGDVFPSPMPALEKLFGGRREDAPVLAGMLLRLAR